MSTFGSASWPLLMTLLGIGLVGSFLSGLLGVGGAVYIIPMLLYGPRLLGTGDLGIKEAAGLSIVLVFVAALSGAIAHRRHATSQCRLCVRLLAPVTAGGALLGGLASQWAPGWLMGGVFAALALLAGTLMFVARPPGGDEVAAGVDVTFPPLKGGLIATGVGLVSGLVGAGGAFILVPLMIYVLKIPTRVTVSSSLAIVFVSALAGLLGKMLAGQIIWGLAVFLVAGAAPGAQLGAWLSHRVRASSLRWVLGGVTLAVAVQLWVDLLF